MGCLENYSIDLTSASTSSHFSDSLTKNPRLHIEGSFRSISESLYCGYCSDIPFKVFTGASLSPCQIVLTFGYWQAMVAAGVGGSIEWPLRSMCVKAVIGMWPDAEAELGEATDY